MHRPVCNLDVIIGLQLCTCIPPYPCDQSKGCCHSLSMHMSTIGRVGKIGGDVSTSPKDAVIDVGNDSSLGLIPSDFSSASFRIYLLEELNGRYGVNEEERKLFCFKLCTVYLLPLQLVSLTERET
eukprot:TRINITY_DN23057_c0_g2_i1.p1 TRINITY_DN23057_c0_g2~~TRINITY_DN23057_c0_g2_i1.p1  ORF type:complete len:126 (+),score=7.19 TRINITY_DN23057_c0_g2_i1:178-555(+)